VPTSDLTTDSASTDRTSEATASYKWVEGNGVRVPFATNVKSNDDEPADPVEFRSTGLLRASYLYAGAKAHTVKWEMLEEDENRAKSLVSSSPGFVAPGFQWPIDNHIASANSKADLEAPFDNVYDGRHKPIDDLDDSDLISWEEIVPGVKVTVEYTPTLYSGRAIGTGCSFRLQAVILLKKEYNLERSPRKKRKVGV
jgi:hypothetical protein